MQTKICIKCGIEKSVGEFHIKKSGQFGVRSDCKVCRKNIGKNEWLKKHPKIIKLSKICTLCNQDLTFYNYTFRKSGYMESKCKKCKIEADRQYRKLHKISPEKRRNYNRKRYAENQSVRQHVAIKVKEYNETLMGKFMIWKRNAKKREIEWNLKFDDIKSLPLACFYTNITLTLRLNSYNTLSLDRINSSIGYEKGNVVFCCKMINFMKLDADIYNFVDMCELVYRNKQNILTSDTLFVNIQHLIKEKS